MPADDRRSTIIPMSAYLSGPGRVVHMLTAPDVQETV